MSNPVIKHQKNVTIPDGTDTDVVRPSDWNADHQITQTTGRMLGRVSAGTGATEELTPEQSRTLMALGTAALVDAKAANISYSNATSGLAATNVQAAVDESAAAIGFKARVDVASAATANIGAAGQRDVRITGTTTITAFDTVGEGIYREVLFAGALTLTHNAASLILPGGANITTAVGDTALFRSEGSGNWRCVRYARAAQVPFAVGFAPLPTASAGAGNLVAVDTAANTALVLPAGGTWFYSAIRLNIVSTGAVSNKANGIAAGGTTVGTAQADEAWWGFAWRIS